MVPQVAHVCPVLPAGIGPDLSLCSVIHKVPDPVHLPLALVPGSNQVPMVWDHCNQAPVLDLMLSLCWIPSTFRRQQFY